MDTDEEIAKLTIAFKQLGAGADQARVMARQLSKRATQLAEDRGIGRVEALDHLLKLVVSGRSGEAPESFAEGDRAADTGPDESPGS